ncbi:MAG TPA: hypothetical protein PKY30_26115 [Myxococcota bacterium]|nr:hypothetical protein [Myxococcota bacterium]HNH50535.1 hypothetical protein [Myxococcota bacterium]
MWQLVRSGYRSSSLVALGILGAVYAAVALIWNQYIDISRGMDWLLVGIWAFMTAVLCWNIQPRRDILRVGVGFVGGLCIEAWGTLTELWTYFTVERPPLWILPAWPVAALAIDRMAQVLDSVWPQRGAWPLWALLLPSFVIWMSIFVQPTWEMNATRLAMVGMVGVLVTVRDPRSDLLLFVSGSVLGIFLEYWGTSRYCWTYYTREIPPLQAMVAHGFASVAFARGVSLLEGRLR